MSESATIVWVINRLSEVGGGEKLLLEGAKHYRSIGYRVVIFTWEFDIKALFEDKYENLDIINFNEFFYTRDKIFKRAYSRFLSIFKFRKEVQKLNPALVICQGEYDVAFVYVSLLLTKIKYTFLIFGQMFQYPNDLAKYSLIFKKNLSKIVNSQVGYQKTIPLKKPKTSLLNNLSNELISVIRYFAVRKAAARFVFSKSVQWENSILFKTTSIINKGAYGKGIFKESIFERNTILDKYKIPKNKKILLSFSRLDPKKRIDVIIEALPNLDENFVLVIAGKGTDQERLKKVVENYNLQNRVFFIGYVEEEHANSIKYYADIFISLDIGDFDISPFEALALNKKVIFPIEIDLDDNLESNENIFITKPTVSNLSKTILAAYDSKSNKDNIRVMKNYTWENYFNVILNKSLNEN